MQKFDRNIKELHRGKTTGRWQFFVLKIFIFFTFCFFTITAHTSNPVTVVVSLSPPYTPFLNQYGSSGLNNLQVTLIVNDSRMVNYPAKLQMLVERIGSGIVMRTGEYAAIAPILLTGNVAEVFSGADLSSYFLARNNVFAGFSHAQYVQTGRIPDGQYRIGFRVVDARRTDVVISNTAYTQPGWFVLNDPPIINRPLNEENIRVNDPQNVLIQWSPRHLGSLNSAFATQYRVELFALRTPGMNANHVAMSVPPDFTDITGSTRYILTNSQFPLEPGMEYALRIKAMAGDDQLTLFQNNGYSGVISFTYGTRCPLPANPSARTSGISKAEIIWDTDPQQSSFETRFRRAGHANGNWHTRTSFAGSLEIANGLSPGVKYEYQVKANCAMVESDYTTLAYFTMPSPAATDFRCGAVDSIIVSNTTPKAFLQVGDIIFYGKFPIRLTEVSGGNGTFRGKGRMRIPFMANVAVNMQFDEIKVNELDQVYSGELVSIYNPDSRLLFGDFSDLFAEGDQIGNIIDGVDSAAITLAFPVSNVSNLNVSFSGNTVTVYTNGQTITTTVENLEHGTTIVDSEGNLYAVDSLENVTHVGKSTMGTDAGVNADTGVGFSTSTFDSEIYDEIKAIFTNNSVLTPDEIKGVREQIAMLKDEEQKKELYLELQKKVPYRSQRDNESPATDEDIANNRWMRTHNISTAGDIMCNLTSQVMCLEYLGVSPPCKGCPSSCDSYDQFEDYLECVRVDKGFEHRGKSNTRKELSKLFDNVSYKFVNLETYEKAVIESRLKTNLENGCSVVISAFGHIVRLQSITKDGLIIDDPYGKVVDFSKSGVTPKYKKDGKDYRNGKDFTDKEGNDNVWKWTDLTTNQIKIRYAEIYCYE